jgi:hypothetical protein
MSKDLHPSHAAGAEGSGKEHPDDDKIHVPKGSSRARFLMTALLAILVLTTFTVSREVVDVFTGRNKGRTSYMSWRTPQGKLEEMSAGDFVMVKQDLSRVQAILSGGRNTKDFDDAQTARHILVNALAKAAGVEVTDDELRKIIAPRFGGAEMYNQVLDHYRTTATEFEDTVKAMIRVDRYESLLSETQATPDAAAVVDQWKKSHKEFTIEYVELETEKFADEAKTLCPSGDELQKWFDALPDQEKNQARTPTPPKVSAEFSWFNFDPPTLPDRMLQKYPRPEGEKPEDVARTWYEVNKNTLFRKPDLPPNKAPTPDDIQPFEEVKDRAEAQGLANQCALDWLNDMRGREAKGEAISLVAEGGMIGWAGRQEAVPHARGEWKSLSMAWSGNAVVDALYGPTAETGKLLPDVLVDPKGLFVVRILEKQPSRLPDFAEYQDKAKDQWVFKKAIELALAKLEALRAKLPTQPDPKDPANPLVIEADSAKWRAAAQELGLEIQTQDWFDAGEILQPGKASPALQFLHSIALRSGDVIGLVPKAELAPGKHKAWVARIVGSRDPDEARMTPYEYQNAQQLASYQSRQKFVESTFGSDDYLKQRFGLDLESWRRAATDGSSPGK